ncbi:MAG: secretin N-terminal domain-containing protein [Candidatus Margulisiibacteriota bacterium]
MTFGFVSLVAPVQSAVKDQEVSPQVGKGGNLSFRLKDADIKNVLQIFAKQLGINIVAGEGVAGKISFSFTNVRPREGLESVLRAKGFDWFQEGDTLVVTSKKTVRTYMLEYANAKEVKEALDLVVEGGDSVSNIDSYNALMVKASTENISRIEKTIKDMDIPPSQVLIETKIIEIKWSDGGNAGVDIKYTRPQDANDYAQTKNLAGRVTDTGAQGFYAHAITTNVEAFVSALETQTGYNLVASPRLTALNHKRASILIGSKLGYRTAVITDTGTVYQVNFLTTGTELKLTPHISESGYVRMEIEPKISEGSVTADQPVESTTETKNEVLVKDGQTIVIGGLIKNTETQTDSGIPLLMNLPLLGGLFRKTTISNEKRELMVIVTPHILTPEYLNEMSKDIKTLDQKEKSQGSGFIH